MATPRLVHFARHGIILSNLEKRYAGRSAESLNAEGRSQAIELAHRLLPVGITEIWSSQIVRAYETALIVSEITGAEIRIHQALGEMRLGPWEGLTEADVAHRYPEEWRLWCSRPDQLALPGRETLAELADRVMPVVQQAAEQDRPVLLMTHVAPIRVAALRISGQPLARYKQIAVKNAEHLVADLTVGVVRRSDGTEVTPECADGGMAAA